MRIGYHMPRASWSSQPPPPVASSFASVLLSLSDGAPRGAPSRRSLRRVRVSHVGEAGLERNVVGTYAVANVRYRSRPAGGWTREWATRLTQNSQHRLDLDVHDVVSESPPIGEAIQLATEHAKRVDRVWVCATRRDRRVEPKFLTRCAQVRRLVESLDSRQKDADQVIAVVLGCRAAAQAGEERVEIGGENRVRDPAQELAVARRCGRVEEILLVEADHDLIDQGIPQPRHLHRITRLGLGAI